MTTTELLLRYAKIYSDNVEGLSLDLRIESRRLAFEGHSSDLVVYPSVEPPGGFVINYSARTVTTDQIPAWFRWLAGLGETP